jgi:8-oxo-dGTP diphosphatase
VKRVQVVAAVVRRGSRILVTRRQPGGPLGDLWEFPGGKVEAGESEPEALRREITEELGCEVTVGRLLFRHAYDYPHAHVDLAFYDCSMAEAAEPRLLGVAELEWTEPEKLSSFEFCPADVAVLERIARDSAV